MLNFCSTCLARMQSEDPPQKNMRYVMLGGENTSYNLVTYQGSTFVYATGLIKITKKCDKIQAQNTLGNYRKRGIPWLNAETEITAAKDLENLAVAYHERHVVLSADSAAKLVMKCNGGSAHLFQEPLLADLRDLFGKPDLGVPHHSAAESGGSPSALPALLAHPSSPPRPVAVLPPPAKKQCTTPAVPPSFEESTRFEQIMTMMRHMWFPLSTMLNYVPRPTDRNLTAKEIEAFDCLRAETEALFVHNEYKCATCRMLPHHLRGRCSKSLWYFCTESFNQLTTDRGSARWDRGESRIIARLVDISAQDAFVKKTLAMLKIFYGSDEAVPESARKAAAALPKRELSATPPEGTALKCARRP